MIDKYPERTELAYIKRGGQWSRCLHELEVAHALRLLHNVNAQVVGTFEPWYMGPYEPPEPINSPAPDLAPKEEPNEKMLLETVNRIAILPRNQPLLE